ncbi:hypothetical protein PTKIN_Ptkin15bG0078800 [Pterospermum kingtungense]
MASELDPPKSPTQRHKCPACYKQFKRKLHLIEHMKIAYHSVHQPRCGVCQKHCKSFESVREHVCGPLAKSNCSKIFGDRGCNLCLKVFDSLHALNEHKQKCCLTAPVPLGTKIIPCIESHVLMSRSVMDEKHNKVQRAVAMDCEMVGGGSDGSINLCARVCLVDEDENLILHTYIQPQIPVTDYRYDIQSGIHDPYEDCISVMRLYKRMCGQEHQVERFGDKKANIGFDSTRSSELDKMTPEELYEISVSDYKCWCLDLRKDCSPGS